MSEHLLQLEKAEDLIIDLLETASVVMSKLKHIQSNEVEKEDTIMANIEKYYTTLKDIKDILLSENSTLENVSITPTRLHGYDKLAMNVWEGTVFADNLREILDGTENESK